LKILDLCTGSGCIPLLSYYEFNKRGRVEDKDLEVVGVDISSTAIALAKKNLLRLVEEGMLPSEANLRFLQADILASKDGEGGGVMGLNTVLEQYTSTSTSGSTSAATTGRGDWDILISNPPYISPSAFAHTTTRSVKRYEPRLALVPPSTSSSSSSPSLNFPSSPSLNSPSSASLNSTQADTTQGDLFYPRLLTLASSLNIKVLLFEVADLEQAKRVAEMARKQGVWEGVEIWRDDPCGVEDHEGFEECSADMVGDGRIKVLGAGNGRTVVAYRGEGKDWMCANA
jgi:methylase of polypeptide subunit release factors